MITNIFLSCFLYNRKSLIGSYFQNMKFRKAERIYSYFQKGNR